MEGQKQILTQTEMNLNEGGWKGNEEPIVRPEDQDQNEELREWLWESTNDTLPIFPKHIPSENKDMVESIQDWQLLRCLFAITQSKPSAPKQVNILPTLMAIRSDPYLFIHYQFDSYYPSVFGYYNLLPKFFRDQDNVKLAVIAMEKYAYDLTLQEKLNCIN